MKPNEIFNLKQRIKLIAQKIGILEMEQVIIRYDGEKLIEHSMSLKLLSESLCGLNDLISEVYGEMGGDTSELDIEIKGGFQKGSFEFLLTITQALEAHSELLKIIGFGAPLASGSLVSYLQWLRGRKIERLTLTEEGACKIKADDGEERESPGYMRELLSSPSIRNAFEKIIAKPLKGDGITLFETLAPEGRTTHTTVAADNSSYFRHQRNPVIDLTITRLLDETVITFLTVHKDKDHHWRIDFDGEALTVKMDDVDFLTNFRQGHEPDIFINAYTVQLVEKENSITLDKSYSIVKVLGPA